MSSYRVRVAGRIFENPDPKVLIKRAVAAAKARRRPVLCRRCGGTVSDPEFTRFGYCFGCIDQAVSMMIQSQRRANHREAGGFEGLRRGAVGEM